MYKPETEIVVNSALGLCNRCRQYGSRKISNQFAIK